MWLRCNGRVLGLCCHHPHLLRPFAALTRLREKSIIENIFLSNRQISKDKNK